MKLTVDSFRVVSHQSHQQLQALHHHLPWKTTLALKGHHNIHMLFITHSYFATKPLHFP
jgi:hypothetical protein